MCPFIFDPLTAYHWVNTTNFAIAVLQQYIDPVNMNSFKILMRSSTVYYFLEINVKEDSSNC